MDLQNSDWWAENAAEYDQNSNQMPGDVGTPQSEGAGGYSFDAQFAEKVREWYLKYLGREATDAEIQMHWGNPGTKAGKLPDVQEVIMKSQDATDYKAKLAAGKVVSPASAGGGYQNLGDLANMGQSGVWEGRFDFPTYTPPAWNAGAAPGAKLPTFSAPQFDAPTSDQITSDEGFKARLALGQDAIERSAAAKGTLLTSGTMKGINQFAQDYGSAEYEKAFQRALQDYQANYGGKWDEYQSKYNAAGTNYSRAKDAYDAQYSTAANTYGAAKDKYTQGYNEFLTADTNKFSRLYNLATLGYGAADKRSLSA